MKLFSKIILIALVGAIICATALNACAQIKPSSIIITGLKGEIGEHSFSIFPNEILSVKWELSETVTVSGDTINKAASVDYTRSVQQIAGVNLYDVKSWSVVVNGDLVVATGVVTNLMHSGIKKMVRIHYVQGFVHAVELVTEDNGTVSKKAYVEY